MNSIDDIHQYILNAVDNYAGDDLERARAAFRGMSPAEMDHFHGQSGKTRREILKGYEDRRELHKDAMEYLRGHLGMK